MQKSKSQRGHIDQHYLTFLRKKSYKTLKKLLTRPFPWNPCVFRSIAIFNTHYEEILVHFCWIITQEKPENDLFRMFLFCNESPFLYLTTCWTLTYGKLRNVPRKWCHEWAKPSPFSVKSYNQKNIWIEFIILSQGGASTSTCQWRLHNCKQRSFSIFHQ